MIILYFIVTPIKYIIYFFEYECLQDIVTRNIHELGTKALNTTEIAKQCKHLMVTHNIGQRLFAKYVMNQVVKVFDSLIFVFHFNSLN